MKKHTGLWARVVLAAVLAMGFAAAQAATVTGVKLTTLTTNADLGSSVYNNGQLQVYGGNAYGTFVAVDNGSAQASWPLFGPTSVPSGGGATGAPPYAAWTGATQTTSGTGSAANPWKIVTTGAQAGTTGITVTQTDTLIDPNEFYRTDITVSNTSATAKTIILYRAMDCSLGASDSGFGMLAGNTVGCIRRDTAALPNNSTNPTQPISRVEQFMDLTGGAKKELNDYGSIWRVIGQRGEYSDRCSPNCNAYQDNGMGLSWRITLPAGSSRTFSQNTLFSPTGTFPLTSAATATPAVVPAGSTVNYTITLTNPNTNSVNAQTVSFVLPAGFSFVPGTSTSGFPQPTVAGSTMTWTGSVPVAANNGTITLTFQAQVAATVAPGTYTSDVSGTAAGGFVVMPSTATAPVQVTKGATTATAAVPANNPWALALCVCAIAGIFAKRQRRKSTTV